MDKTKWAGALVGCRVSLANTWEAAQVARDDFPVEKTVDHMVDPSSYQSTKEASG